MAHGKHGHKHDGHKGHSGNKHESRGHKGGHDYMGKGLLGKTPKALKQRTKHQLVKQATHLMNKEYKGAFNDLDTQREQAVNIANKRAADNKYYLDWLTTNTEQLRQHEQTANETLLQAQSQITDQANQAMLGLRKNLVDSGYGRAGNVSNAGQYTGFNISPEMLQGNRMIAAERQRTAGEMYSGQQALNEIQGSNFAMAEASNIKNQSDLANALSEIRSARTKLQLEKGAKTAEEVARLLDQEISKAQARLGMRQSAAGLAMQRKQHKLQSRQERFNEKLQTKRFGLDKQDTKHDNRAQDRGLRETHRHNKATERNTRRSNKETHRHNRATERNDRRNSSSSKHGRKQQVRTISAITKRYLRAHPLPRDRARLQKAIAFLEDRAGHGEGVSDEQLVNRVVRRLVKHAYHHQHGGGRRGGGNPKPTSHAR